MAKKRKANKAQLKERWRQINDTLAGVANLRVWPDGQDIADMEGEFLAELDEIEYQTGRDYPNRA